MSWISVKSQGVRNLHTFEINPSKSINFFIGENGSGKTSVLESICILSTGRSFKGSQQQAVINTKTDQIIVFGKLQTNQQLLHCGVSRNRTLRIRLSTP